MSLHRKQSFLFLLLSLILIACQPQTEEIETTRPFPAATPTASSSPTPAIQITQTSTNTPPTETSTSSPEPTIIAATQTPIPAIISDEDDISGSKGSIVYWDTPLLAPLYSLPANDNILAMSGENEGWRVGDGGFISFWDGTKWNDIESPTTNDLYAVDFIAPDNGWAVGDGGIILHWDGMAWTIIRQTGNELYSGYELQDIAIISDTEVWAAGGVNSEGGGGPLLVHLQWDGQTWQELDPKGPYCDCYLYAIAMLSTSEGWAVGGGGITATTVHWDGSSWQIVSNPGNYWLYSVVALASNEVWASGTNHDSDIVLHWDGQEWQEAKKMTVPASLLPLPTSEEWLKGKWILYEGFFWNGEAWGVAGSATHRVLGTDMSSTGELARLTDVGFEILGQE